jgi:hypothetical protein
MAMSNAVDDAEITITMSRGEAARLYASAVFYEAHIHRIAGIGRETEIANSALIKLATAVGLNDLEAHRQAIAAAEQLADDLIASLERGRSK